MGGELMASFESGATRNTDDGKLDYEGFLSPLVLERYAIYLHKNRHCRDGSFRASDNWQLGIPFDSYMKSGWRHFVAWWKEHRAGTGLSEVAQDALCAVIFNASGYLHEVLKRKAGLKPGGVLEIKDTQTFYVCQHDPIGERMLPCPRCYVATATGFKKIIS